MTRLKTSHLSRHIIVKTEVRRTHVELDALERTKHNVYSWDEKFKEFDTQEEANKWIFENDESRWPCESGKSFFEGYRYYIKRRSIYDTDQADK